MIGIKLTYNSEVLQAAMPDSTLSFLVLAAEDGVDLSLSAVGMKEKKRWISTKMLEGDEVRIDIVDVLSPSSPILEEEVSDEKLLRMYEHLKKILIEKGRI